LRRPLFGIAFVLAALGCAACSYPLGSLVSKPEVAGDVTGSISPVAAHPVGHADLAIQPSPGDLAYARAAAEDALSRTPPENSVPWRNPQTGVGGNITPLASAHSEGGAPCRDFLASYRGSGAQSWLQGSACRTAAGKWEVKSLKPFKSG
jgi:hypothetical protein